jgi:hypothetical protein
MATIFWRDEAAGEYDPFGGRRDDGICEAGLRAAMVNGHPDKRGTAAGFMISGAQSLPGGQGGGRQEMIASRRSVLGARFLFPAFLPVGLGLGTDFRVEPL